MQNPSDSVLSADPIETLMNEHQLILMVNSSIRGMLMQSQDALSAAMLSDLKIWVRFIKRFADFYHHGKEENILFESMLAHGFSKQSGPIAVMLSEHDEGRSLVARAHAILEQSTGPLLAKADLELRACILDFMDLLGAHIQKEDGILYPMAMRNLPPAALSKMAQDFDLFSKDSKLSAEMSQIQLEASGLLHRYPFAESDCEDESCFEGGGCSGGGCGGGGGYFDEGQR